MRLLNLFDGIGGFALAAEWMGWENVASCEIDPFCRRVLDYHFNYKHVYHDIKTTDFTPLRGGIDLITGGFPCQPFSLAGKQRGTEDDRYLFPEMLRVIREVRPRWVVAENVRGLLTQSDGVVFEQVCAGLETAGYEVQPFVLPAAGVGAPHRRDRLWIVAHRADTGIKRVQGGETEILPSIDVADPDRDRCRDGKVQHEHREEREAEAYNSDDGAYRTADNAVRIGRIKGEFPDEIDGERKGERQPHPAIGHRYRIRGFDWFPTQSPVCSGDDGLSSRLDGITFPKWREQSVKAFGNAVVPQVVYQIFKAIGGY